MHTTSKVLYKMKQISLYLDVIYIYIYVYQAMQLSSNKRKFEFLQDIDQPDANVDLHFAVTALSPLKTASSGVPYFNASVTDGTSREMRLVGFDEKQQAEISALVDIQTPIKAENCSTKKE